MLLLSGNLIAQEAQRQRKAHPEIDRPETAGGDEVNSYAHPEGELAPQPGTSSAIALFCNVKYKDLDEMAPCAAPKIIAVKDPCACYDGCCAPPCVYIKICVPCGCEVVTCSKNGDRIRYDYGKYAVDIRVKKGYIEVDYQD
jgi:hypothetical protein